MSAVTHEHVMNEYECGCSMNVVALAIFVNNQCVDSNIKCADLATQGR